VAAARKTLVPLIFDEARKCHGKNKSIERCW
jgi:hypothetical protein